jgi:serine/threonine protein kinase
MSCQKASVQHSQKLCVAGSTNYVVYNHPMTTPSLGFMLTGVMSFRIAHPSLVGPFASQDEFHAQHFCQPFETYHDELSTALDKRAKTQYKICFTHGDITPHNILVDEDLRPCALIDWECAGWMPEYWEYTRALYLRTSYLGWKDVFTDIFPDYEAELKIEEAIWKHYIP